MVGSIEYYVLHANELYLPTNVTVSVATNTKNVSKFSTTVFGRKLFETFISYSNSRSRAGQKVWQLLQAKNAGSRYATLDKKNAGQGYFIPSKYVDSIIGKPVGF